MQPSPLTTRKMTYLNHFVFTFILTINLMGCVSPTTASPTSTPVPPTKEASPTPSSCIVGIWEIKDKEMFLRALVPVGAFEPAQLDYVKTIGSVAYRFDNQGILTVEAVELHGRFDAKVDNEIGLLDIMLSGFASGRYELDGDNVSISEMLSSDMAYSAFYTDEEMMADAKADAYLPLFIETYNSARYECSKESLALYFTDFPNLQGPLEFIRLR